MNFNGCFDNECLLLSRLPCLQHINITWFGQMTDDNLKHFSNMKKLQYLSIGSTRHIMGCHDGVTDDGLRYLSTIDSLRTLDISFCKNVTDVGLKYLCTSNIQNLNIEYCKKITDDGLR